MKSKKHSSQYLVDPSLIPKVKQYLRSCGSTTVDIEKMAEEIQAESWEYKRKKKKVFVASVEKAYQIILKRTVNNKQMNGGSLASRLEKQHLSRKRKTASEPVSPRLSDEDSFSSDNDNYVSYPDTNSVNATLSSLYTPVAKKGCGFATNFIIDKTPSSSIIDVDLTADNDTDVPNSSSQKPLSNGVLFSVRPPLDGAENSANVSLLRKQSKRGSGSGTPKTPLEKSNAKQQSLRSPASTFEFETSALTFADIGGCEKALVDICKMLMHMKHPEIYRNLGVMPPRGFLLHGPPGCGKTLLAYAVAGEFGILFIKLAATELVSGISGESEQKIRDLFERASQVGPCILFIDEIDAITPKRETAQREMERRIVAQLQACLDDLSRKPDCRLMLIGATSRPDALDPSLRRAGRFDKEIALGIPDERARAKILAVVCRGLHLAAAFDFGRLARCTPGFVGADLSALVAEASTCAVERVFRKLQAATPDVQIPAATATTAFTASTSANAQLNKLTEWLKQETAFDASAVDDVCVEMDDFQEALKLVHPSAKREGFATVPDVSWSDVGALNSIREELKWSILYPIQHPEQFEQFGLSSRPQGILLCGPPGCGKTLLAKAIANETGMNFISIKGPELLSMYVGESERAVRQVFQRAANSAPCVIFFDELDALCPRRSDSDSGGSVRVVNQLLTEMDGIEARKHVFLIGATNRPDIIDPAIMRPGRLDKVLYVGFPTSAERADILRALTKNGQQPPISSDFSFSLFVEDSRLDWFSGADMAAIVREASVAALKESMRMGSVGAATECSTAFSNDAALTVDRTCSVKPAHFEHALQRIKPSVSAKERERYEALRIKYSST